jgi:hypothetical protein
MANDDLRVSYVAADTDGELYRDSAGITANPKPRSPSISRS